jgi:hypothetical protein
MGDCACSFEASRVGGEDMMDLPGVMVQSWAETKCKDRAFRWNGWLSSDAVLVAVLEEMASVATVAPTTAATKRKRISGPAAK